jgi:uncharacterized membrane protein
MSNFVVNAFYMLDDLIDLVKERKDRDAVYMIYVRKDVNDLQPGMEV